MDIDNKHEALKNVFHEMERVVIGFSGGVDSTLLMKVATDVLGHNAVGVIAKSSTYPERELKEALTLADEMKAKITIVETEEDKNPKFLNNPVDRCFFCKDELFSKMQKVAEQEGIEYLADGTNADDVFDHRPGMKAVEKFKVRSPLKEAGMNKQEIRELSKKLGLPTHDKQSFACLSSRFPYGTKITKDNLDRIDAAENLMMDHGFTTVRVRHYDQTVRIELKPEDFPMIMKPDIRTNIVKKLKELGYVYITLDLEGFRSGSMNEVLDL